MIGQKSDHLLARAAREGDQAALALLYDDLGPPLLGFLNQMVQDRSIAEDLLHDTFLRLLQGRSHPGEDSGIKPWLFTVARNLALDFLRSRRRRNQLDRQLDGKSIMGSMPPTDSGNLNDFVERTLATLPEKYRTTFHLRIKQDFTYQEMAAICDEPEGTLRSRVHHIMGLLRKGLTEK